MNNVIAIQLNDVFLDLNDAGIRIEKTNPFFSPSVYQGDYSFPYTLPATDKNMKALGFVNFVAVSDKKLQHPVTVYVFGIPQFSLKLNITKASRRAIEVVLTGGIKSLKNADKTLTEIFSQKKYYLGNSREAVFAKATEISKVGDWQEYGFTFVPFYAPNFYGSKNPSFCGVVNRMNSVTGDIIANDNTNANKYTLVPWLFLHHVLYECFKLEGLNPVGNFWTHPELNKLLLFNNYSFAARANNDNASIEATENQVLNANIRPKFTPFQLDSFDNLGGYDISIDEYVILKAGTFHITYYMLGTINSTASVRPPVIKPGVFKIYYDGTLINTKEVKGSYEEETSVVLGIDIVAGAGDIGKTVYVEFEKDTGTFQTQSYYDLSKDANIQVVVEGTVAETSGVVEYKNHLPNWTLGKLLNEVKKLGVNIEIDSNNGTVQMDIVDELLNLSTAKDLTSKSEPAYLNDMESAQAGIKISYEFEDGDNAEIELDPSRYRGEVFDDNDLPTAANEGDLMSITNTNDVVEVQPVGASKDWISIGHNYSPRTYGNGKEEVKCELAPMLMARQHNEGGTSLQNSALMPYFRGTGSSPLYGLGINPFTPRLVFYRGENVTTTVDSPEGGKYILATTQRYGINGNLVGNYSFRLDQSSGIIPKHTDKVYTSITAGEIVEKNLYFTASDFFNLKTFGKWLIDNDLFLIKSLSIFINNRSAKVKAYLLKL